MTSDIIFRGAVCRNLRVFHGWSRIDLARELLTKHEFQMSADSIRVVESGQRQPRPAVALAMSKLFGVPVSDLYVEVEIDDAPPAPKPATKAKPKAKVDA